MRAYSFQSVHKGNLGSRRRGHGSRGTRRAEGHSRCGRSRACLQLGVLGLLGGSIAERRCQEQQQEQGGGELHSGQAWLCRAGGNWGQGQLGMDGNEGDEWMGG